MLDILRIVCLLLWVPPALMFTAPAYRLLRGQGCGLDSFYGAFFFTALLNIGFVLRWLVAPEARSVWAALYALCGLLAVYTLLLRKKWGARIDA